jgi:hypothetical protein
VQPTLFSDDMLVKWLSNSFSLQKIADRIDSLRREYEQIRRVSPFHLGLRSVSLDELGLRSVSCLHAFVALLFRPNLRRADTILCLRCSRA